MKKRVVKVLLPLLFSFCCVFSGFLSVKGYAAEVSPDAKNEWFLLPFDKMLVGNGEVVGSFSASGGTYNGVVNGVTSNDWWRFVCSDLGGVFPSFNPDNKYLVYFTVSATTGVNCGFDALRYREDMANSSGFNVMTNVSNFSTFVNDTVTLSGFCSYNTFDLNLSTGSAFYIDVTTPCIVDGRVSWAFYALDVTNETEEQINSIIAAINNQTGALQGSIGQATDDIQQSIEDQYSGEPETEFSVDDVITQHNEKMGVLSFGSDVMLQFLDMFQSANVGTAELTLPGFNITVENVEYSVWPDYSFNFEQLNEWVPALMSVIRVMLPLFVWLMVLRYCINVFEKNFLSNGG